MYTDDYTGERLEKLRTAGQSKSPPALRVRCPWCGHRGVLVRTVSDLSNGMNQSQAQYRGAGIHHCPNPDCGGLVFVVVGGSGAVLACLPPERIEIDGTDIPPDVLDRLNEAVTSHAQSAYRAAGAMLRSTVEMMCEERGVAGANLKDRLNDLAAVTSLTQAHIEALDNLRLLGNDSVHALSKDFSNVTAALIEDATMVVKAVLQQVYQQQAIMSVLEKHKKPTAP